MINNPEFWQRVVVEGLGSHSNVSTNDTNAAFDHDNTDAAIDHDNADAVVDHDKAEPKWPIKSPPVSDEESDEPTNSSSSSAFDLYSNGDDESDAEKVVLDVDRVDVTFSTS